MEKEVILVILLNLCLNSMTEASAVTDTLNITPFGKVVIYKQDEKPENLVIMISGDGGWKYGVTSFAERFSKINTMVAGVDIVKYYKVLRLGNEECYNVAADFINLATIVEKKYNFPEYKPAVIMGYSSGATLVYCILAQSRPGAFLGGISLGFCQDIEIPRLLCQINGLTMKTDIPGKRYILQPDAKLSNHWIVFNGKLDKVCSYSEAAIFVNKTSDAELITLDNVGHGFSKQSDFMPQWINAYKSLVSNPPDAGSGSVSPDEINRLPLAVTDARTLINDAPVAFIVSGDGGWYHFEQSIADQLANLGIPTIGLDSKRYFWNRKSPDQTAEDVAKSMNYFGSKWGKDRFVFIGYSLGAEAIPFIMNRLPSNVKAKVVSAILLSPSSLTDFEIHISDMLGINNRADSYDVISEIAKVKGCSIMAIFGEEEKTMVPKQLDRLSCIVRIVPGDHHYKFDTPLLIKIMRENHFI